MSLIKETLGGIEKDSVGLRVMSWGLLVLIILSLIVTLFLFLNYWFGLQKFNKYIKMIAENDEQIAKELVKSNF